MTHHNERARRAEQRDRARDAFESSPASNCLSVTRSLTTVQADFLARKFGLTPHLASIVASLAWEARQ